MCTPDPKKYELTWALYTKNGLCANYRSAFCQRAKNIAGEMSADPGAFVAANEERQGWVEGMKSCGIDPDKITPPCKQGVSGKNWEFVAAHCHKETTTIAKKECAGRDYTSAMESEYRPICVKFASDNVGRNVFKEGNAPAQGSSAKSDGAGGAAKTLKNGIKGMFGF